MKKLICLTLVALMLLSMLVACAGGGGEDTTPSTDDDGSDVVTEPKETDEWGQEVVKVDLPNDLDFENVVIGIACRPEYRYRREISVEQATNPLDMAISQRNTQVEKQLKVKLQFIEAMELWGNSTDHNIFNYVKAEEDLGAQSSVDIILANAAYAVTTNMLGHTVNFNGEDLKYINTNKAYWNQSYIDAATCYGQLYYIIGDLTLTIYDKAMVNFVNFDVASNVLNMSADDFYTAVEDGEWTYNMLYDCVTNFTYMDNGTEGVVDKDDQIAISTIFVSESFDGYYSAFNIDVMNTEADGSHTVNVAGNEKLDKGAGMIYELYSSQGVFRGSTSTAFDTFHAGNTLFLTDLLFRNETQNEKLRTATTFKYGILPLPLYEAKQYNKELKNLGYQTTSQDAYNAISVIRTHPEKYEAISAALELLASKSYDDIRPYYIKRMVQDQYAQDQQSANMVDIIMSGLVYNTEWVYAGQVAYVGRDMWRHCCSGKSLTDTWEGMRAKVNDTVESFDMWYQMAKNS